MTTTSRSSKLFALILAAVLAACAIACTDGAAAASAAVPDRGALLSVRHLGHVGTPSVRHDLVGLGIDPAETRDPVETYRLVYRTVSTSGKATRASGLLVVPDGVGDEPTMAVYEHGTQSARSQSPSVPGPNDGYISGLILGSSGLVVAAPDYLGLGVGQGPHPYLDARSETSASVDMVKAARTFLERRGERPDPRLMVTGFSQGGAAAVALGRRLQEDEPYGLSLAALAPISGPYELRGVELPDALAGRLDPAVTPFYIGYLLTAWDRTYHLFPRPATVFRAPYDREVGTLFGGGDDLPEIAAALPANLGRLLTPAGFGVLRHPHGRFAAALRSSQVCRGWKPAVPVHLFAARGDQVVPIANARACVRQLRAAGGTASLTDVGNVDHDHSAFRAVPRVASLFDRLGSE